jgi:hypothetical protein
MSPSGFQQERKGGSNICLTFRMLSLTRSSTWARALSSHSPCFISTSVRSSCRSLSAAASWLSQFRNWQRHEMQDFIISGVNPKHVAALQRAGALTEVCRLALVRSVVCSQQVVAVSQKTDKWRKKKQRVLSSTSYQIIVQSAHLAEFPLS